MDMWEEAIKAGEEKPKVMSGKLMIDMMLDTWFDKDSVDLARVFFYALVENGCPPAAIFKALTKAANMK